MSPIVPRVERVNIAQKLELFDEYWSPRIVGTVNDSHIQLVSGGSILCF